MRRSCVPPLLALLCLLARCPALAAAPPAPNSVRLQLDQAHQFSVQARFAAVESLATVVRDDLQRQAHPDTVLLAEAWSLIAESRNRRFLLSDPTGRLASERSLELLQACRCGPDTLRVVDDRALAWVLGATRRTRDALGHYRAALAIVERHPEWGLLPFSVLHYNVGVSLGNLGENDSALAALSEALELRRRLAMPRDPMPGDIEGVRGTILEQQGRYDLAELSFRDAIHTDEQALGPDSPVLNGPLSRAAAFAFRRGDYARAYDLYARAAQVLVATPKDPNLLVMRVGMAQTLDQMGDVQRARAIFEEVLPGMEARFGGQSPAVLGSWLSLASACSKLGDEKRAHELYGKVRQAYAGDTTRTERVMLAAALTSEAFLFERLGIPDSVLSVARLAEEIGRADGTPDPTTMVQALTYQLRIRGRRGEWDEADSLDARLQRVLDRSTLQGNNMTDDAWCARSDVAEERGRHADALAAAAAGAQGARERLLRNARALSDRQALVMANVLSTPLDQLLMVGAASDPASIRRCWDEVVRTRGLVRAEVSRRRLPAAAVGDTALARAHGTWVRAEQHLAQFEVDVAGSPRDPEIDSTLAALRAAVDESERRLAMVAERVVLPVDPASVNLDAVLARLAPGQALVGFVQCPRREGTRHLLAFVARGGTSEVVSADLGDVDELAAVLGAWRGQLGELDPQRRSESACRRAGAQVRARVWDPLAAATGDARDVFVVPEAPVAGLPWGALPSGARGYLVESGTHVHVLDAERELMPAGAASDGRGLLAVGGVDFDREPARDAATSPTAATSRAPLSDCDRDALSHLPPLPGTAAEVREVADAWSQDSTAEGAPTRLEGEAATESAFKRLAGRQRVLHLATHGIALSDSCGRGIPGARGAAHAADGSAQPAADHRATARGVGGVRPLAADRHGTRARSKSAPDSTAAVSAARAPSPWMGRQVLLALADANHALEHQRDADDGLLTAEEVTTLDLRGVDWVVLSACHSGVGESWAREGVLGMQRAFHLAGARTVIASQWSVDDDATRDWMRALYQARAHGATSAAQAMGDASRAVLAARRHGHQSTHPFYWAAFTASGE